MASIALHLGGATGLTALHLDSGPPAGIIAFFGYPIEITTKDLGLTSTYGALSFSGFPSDITLNWTGGSPSGLLQLDGYPQSIISAFARDDLDAAHGTYSLAGYGVQISDRKTWIPLNVFPGFTSDGVSISIPISSLIGLSTSEADNVSGDWRKIFQSLLLTLEAHLSDISILDRPAACSLFMLENWNAKSSLFEYGYGTKRIFHVHFNINYTFQKIKDEVQ
jgi:hypothetical protein